MKAAKREGRQAIAVLLLAALLFGSLTPAAGQAQPLQDSSPVAADFLTEQGESVTVAVYDHDHAAEPLAPPVLDEMPSVSADTSITIGGRALPGTEVSVWYKRDDEPEVSAGAPVQVEDDGSGDGRFSVTIGLDAEGTYVFTAEALDGEQRSERSSPIQVTIDWSPPGEVRNLTWTLLDSDRVQLNWEPPEVSDGANGPDALKYRIYSEDYVEVALTADTSFILEGLEEGQLHRYMVAAVDQAGNESSATEVMVGASPASEVKLADLTADFSDSETSTVAISADGSTVVYADRSADLTGWELYALDTKTTEKTKLSITEFGAPINGEVWDLDVDRTGNSIVFASNATNLLASPDKDGDHIYWYNRAQRNLQYISYSGEKAEGPSISGNGSLVALTMDDRVYAYSPLTREHILVSRALDPDEDGKSGSPAISGNGTIIAFASDSSNLTGPAGDGKEHAVYLFETGASSITGRFKSNEYHESLTISDDGRYIAYNESAGSSSPGHPYLYDRSTGEIADLNAGRSETDVMNKSYGKLSLSDDGRYVLAQLYDAEPDVEGMGRYNELFDTQTGAVTVVGNPALPSSNGVMDGTGERLVYVRGQALYMMCTSDCGDVEPEKPLSSAFWSVPTSAWVDEQLKPGSQLTIQASGEHGLSIRADVSYKEGDEPKNTVLTLREDTQTEGLYSAPFTVGEGITELTSISVALQDNSHSITLERLPVKVSGLLSVDIETERRQLLSGARLLVTKPNAQVLEMAVDPNTLSYAIPLAAGELYALELQDASGAIRLAEQRDITISHAETTAVKLVPHFPSSLTVAVHYDKPPAEQAIVEFRSAADDTLIAEVRADQDGKAQLPGTHEAGETITVSVLPPAGYDAAEPQTVTLELGGSQLTFDLRQTAAAVKEMAAVFSQVVGYAPYQAVVMASEAKLTASGKPGMRLEGELLLQRLQDDSSVQEVKKTIPMTEVSPGSYEGVFLVEEGDVRYETVTPLADGMPLGDAYPVGMNVAGRLQLNIELPEGEDWADTLERASVIVYDNESSFGYYKRETAKADRLVYTFDIPREKATYRASVRPVNSSMLEASADAPAIRFGKITEVKVKPNFRIRVTGTVEGQDDDSNYARFVLTDASGAIAAQGRVFGRYDIRLDTEVGKLYRLTLTPEDPIYESQTVEFTADRLVKELPFRFAYKDLYPVEGTVLGLDGKPVKSAAVSAELLGTQKIFKVYTNEDGGFAFSAPLGELRFRASSYGTNGKLSKYVTVPVSVTGAGDVELQLLDYGTVDFDLFTKQQGSTWQGPLDIDSRTAAHFQTRSSHAIISYGSPMKVAAVAGDTFRICVNGSQSQLPSGCQEVVIGDDNKAAVEIRLESTGAQVLTAFKQEDGSDTGYVQQQLYRYVDDGLVLDESVVTRLSGSYRIGLSQAGSYRLVAKGKGGSSAEIDFDASLGLPVDLGVITLRKPGRFAGQEGNSFSTASNLTTRDGKIIARISYKNAGSEVEGAEFTVLLPKSISLMPGMVSVNGQPHTDFAQDGQLLTVKVGTIGKLQEGSVRLVLEVDEIQQQSSVALPAAVRYSAEQQQLEETIGTAIVQVAQATLNVPELVVKPTFQVSGIAPANSKVTVLDGSVAVGSALVSPEGTWQASITLADLTHRRHSIRTQVEAGGVVRAGQEAIVLYDPSDPGLEEVSMRQPDGRVHTFRTEDGVAIFPYVYVPGKPILYELTFRDPQRISNVEVWTGNTLAEARLEDGVFKAAVTLKSDPGPIVVTYNKKSEPGELPPPYTEQELRNTLPPEMRDFEVLSAVQPNIGQTSIQTKISLTDDVEVTVTISNDPAAGYVPTTGDLLYEQETGIPLYGSSLSRNFGKSSASATITGYVPVSSSQLTRAASVTELKAIKIIIDIAGKGTQGIDLYNAIKGLITTGPIERANRAYELAQSICDERAREYYMSYAMEIKMDIVFSEIIKNSLNVVSTVALPGLPGLIFWPETVWAGKKLDDVVERELNDIEFYLKQWLVMPCKEIKPPGQPPVAKPGFILDPSGYVYEGLPANRIPDVTATALQWNEDNQTWDVWDAEWYEQLNPLLTDMNGRYAWDVPPGQWKVKFEKDGYLTAYSDELEVPPPQLDVNVPMVSTAPPEVKAIAAEPGGARIVLRFTKPVRADSLVDEAILVTKGGEEIPGALQALEPVPGTDDTLLAMAAVFMPDQPLTVGETYSVALNTAVLSYAGIPLSDVFTQELLIEGEDLTPPGDVGGLAGGLSGEAASLMWNPPADMDYAGVSIRWKEASEDAYGEPLEIDRTQSWAVIDGLSQDRSYDFLVTAKDEYGNESAGVTWSWTAKDRSNDTSAPSAVANLQLSPAGRGKIAVSWSNPMAPDLAKLRIGWQAEEDAGSPAGSAEVAKDQTAYIITGLKQGADYRVFVVAIDEKGNESIASEAVAAAGSGTGGGGNPPSGGGQTPPGDDETPPDGGSGSVWQIGKEGGVFEAYDGRLTVTVQPNSFGQGIDISYGVTDETTGPLNESYTKLSPTYRLNGDPGELTAAIELALGYDPALEPGIDTRRLGVYRKDASEPSGWAYAGGLDEASGSVLRASAAAWGEYAVLLYKHSYDDMTSHWSRAEVDVLTSRHLVTGTSDHRFEPNRLVTRAEMTKLLVEALKRTGSPLPIADSDDRNARFADVPEDAWYTAYVKEAVKLGLVQGANGRFRPQDPVTREEMMVLFARFAQLAAGLSADTADDGALSRFEDADELSSWARKAAQLSVSRGWVTGVTETALRPKGKSTRAEAAVILLRVMDDLGFIRVKASSRSSF